MRSSQIKLTGMLALLVAMLSAQVSYAYMFTVTMDTTPLIGSPFAIDFQLSDGNLSFLGDGNNTVTISGFNVDGALPVAIGTPTFSGGGVGPNSGDLSSSVILTDSDPNFNAFRQSFMPGSSLSFTVSLNPNISVDELVTPDVFSFFIYNGTGSKIATTGPANAFFYFDINSANPAVHTYSRVSPYSDMEPNIGGSAVPEPATSAMFLIGGALMAWPIIRRRRLSSALCQD